MPLKREKEPDRVKIILAAIHHRRVKAQLVVAQNRDFLVLHIIGLPGGMNRYR